MLPLDEPTLRKASSWQDFKEAQSLLNIGAVTESERTESGWRGSVRIGKRTFRTTVIARTPTWFDAKCPCPANQREGTFCPHAIATGLHLSNPPAKKEDPSPQKKPKNALPSLAWKIRFQGPWQKSFTKSHLAVAISPDEDRSPGPSDDRLTAWLVSRKLTSKPTVQLALDPTTLPSFLDAIRDHPQVFSQDSAMVLESGIQLKLADCFPKNDEIQLFPETSGGAIIGDRVWKFDSETLSSTAQILALLIPVFKKLASSQTAKLPLGTFLKHLDSLQSLLDFSSSDWFSSLQFIPTTPRFVLTLEGSSTKIIPKFQISYPDPDLPRLNENSLITRNRSAEKAATALFQTVVGEAEITEPEAIQKLLTKTLKSLPSNWEISLSPLLEKLSSSYLFISPRIEIHKSNDRSTEFDLRFESSDGSVIPTTEIRRLLRSKGSASHQLRGKNLILSDDIEGLLDPLFADLDLRQENGRFIAKHASAEIIKEIRENIRGSLVSSNLHTSSHSEKPIALPPIKAELRPYQSAGFRWLADRLMRYQGALLADDMGLGKTLQTIVFIEHLLTTCPQPKPALIVVTTSLLGNWKAEFSRFAPNRKVITLHGAKRDSLRDSIRPADIVLTTYSTLARDLAYHLRQEYSVAVIDEASLIRNPDTDHSKAVAKLNSANRIALTGTPVENSARDLWSIFRFIQPGWLGTRKQFEEKYEQPLKSIDTSRRASQLLKLKTSPFLLRRTKQEVAPELPSKIQIDEFCTLSKEQLSTYSELQKEGQRKIDEIRDSGQAAAARMQTLTTLLRLRQACCDLALFDSEKLKALPIPRRSAKLERLLEITEQSIAAGGKLLVFSQFQKQLVEIETQLTASGIPSLRLDGGSRDRQRLVDRFQSEDGPPVFLISLKAGGYGLNLTAADVVVHFDPWWNPAAEAQATDRAHRIGQTKPVTVFRLLTRNTVEEKVTRLQETKKALAASLDESGTPTDAPAWTASELETLLR